MAAELDVALNSGWQRWRAYALKPHLVQRGHAITSGTIRACCLQLPQVLDGTVIGQCQPRHTRAERLKFLRRNECETPKDKTLHLIADNYATHKHPRVQQRLAKHPRFHLHFTPTSTSCLNRTERFFLDILQKVIRTDSRLSSKPTETLHLQGKPTNIRAGLCHAFLHLARARRSPYGSRNQPR